MSRDTQTGERLDALQSEIDRLRSALAQSRAEAVQFQALARLSRELQAHLEHIVMAGESKLDTAPRAFRLGLWVTNVLKRFRPWRSESGEVPPRASSVFALRQRLEAVLDNSPSQSQDVMWALESGFSELIALQEKAASQSALGYSELRQRVLAALEQRAASQAAIDDLLRLAAGAVSFHLDRTAAAPHPGLSPRD